MTARAVLGSRFSFTPVFKIEPPSQADSRWRWSARCGEIVSISRQPQVGHGQPRQERQLGADVVERLADDRIEVGRHLLLLQAMHGGAQDPDGGLGGGTDECPPSACTLSSTLRYPFSAMPMVATGCSMPAGRKPAISEPPSSSTTEGLTPRCSKKRGHRARPLAAADLLVVAEGQVNGASRLEVLREKSFRSFEQAEDARLVVHGAAAPHVTVGDDAVEGRVQAPQRRPPPAPRRGDRSAGRAGPRSCPAK